MTGALNKEAFSERVTQLLFESQSSGTTRLLALIDLDGFKSVNDQYGHDAGDNVLMHFAKGAQATLGHGACFARIGGDEFAILMRVASVSRGIDAAADIHRSLATVLRAYSYPATCSMGALIVSGGSTESYEDLMRKADKLMYAAKRSGKNLVNISADPVSIISAEFSEQIPLGDLARKIHGEQAGVAPASRCSVHRHNIR